MQTLRGVALVISALLGAGVLVGCGSSNLASVTGHAPIRAIISTFMPSYYCPSSALPKRDDDNYGTGSYCGNMGNEVRPFTTPWACGVPAWAHPTNNPKQNGVLNNDANNNHTRVTSMAYITDGTSNTFLVGEVGQSANVRTTIINNGCYPHWAGGNNDGGCTRLAGHLRVADVNFYLNRPFPPTGAPNPDYSDYCFGSFHPNGAQFALCDGSVRFVPNTINTAVYASAAGRDDNIPIQLP